MYETSKLRGRIVEKYGSLMEFSKAAKCSYSFLSQYMSGKKTLKQPMMERWIELLDIDSPDIKAYFFAH